MKRTPTGYRDAHSRLRRISKNWDMYLLMVLPVGWLLIFRYFPMYGAQIAFRRFLPSTGIIGSAWVGFANFTRFFNSFNFRQVMFNTISLSVYQLIAGFPLPIVLALLLHYCPSPTFRRVVQMTTYAPHFISTVVMVGIIFKLFGPRVGIVNQILGALGLSEVNFLGSPSMFPHLYVWTDIWQGVGWGSIIYLAALSSVDPELHESAKVDGASIWQRIRHIDLPGIMPTVVIMLILRSGQMLEVGFEKAFLMQNNLNLARSEVIQTFVYRVGLASANPNFSYASAIGLFTSVVSFALLLIVNKVAKRIGETSLW